MILIVITNQKFINFDYCKCTNAIHGITLFQVVLVMSVVPGTASTSLVSASVMKMSLGMTVANVLLITGALLRVRYGMVYIFMLYCYIFRLLVSCYIICI